MVWQVRGQPGDLLGTRQLLKDLYIGPIDAPVSLLKLFQEADVLAVPVAVDLFGSVGKDVEVQPGRCGNFSQPFLMTLITPEHQYWAYSFC